MSHCVAIWPGARPADDDAAAAEYEARARRADEDPAAAPDGALTRFVAEIIARYPDAGVAADRGPWSDGPLAGNIRGELLVLALDYGPSSEAALGFLHERAAAHGLVCFEPEFGTVLRPPQPRRRGLFRRC